MQCPVCKSDIPDKNIYCSKCGIKIPRCPSCGQAILKRMRFCTNDGTPLPEEIFSVLPLESGSPDTSRADVNLSFVMPAELNYTDNTPRPGSNPDKYWSYQPSQNQNQANPKPSASSADNSVFETQELSGEDFSAETEILSGPEYSAETELLTEPPYSEEGKSPSFEDEALPWGTEEELSYNKASSFEEKTDKAAYTEDLGARPVTPDPAKQKPVRTSFCLQCGKPIYDGFSLCPDCRQIYTVSDQGAGANLSPNIDDTQYIPKDQLYNNAQPDNYAAQPDSNTGYGAGFNYGQQYDNAGYNYGQQNGDFGYSGGQQYDNGQAYGNQQYSGQPYFDNSQYDNGYGSNDGYEKPEKEKNSKKGLLIAIIIIAAVILILAGVFAYLFITEKVSFGNGSDTEISQTEEESGGLIDRSASEEETEEETTAQEETTEEETEEETTTQEETTEEETEEETDISELTGDAAVEMFILTCDTVIYTAEDFVGWDADMCRKARNGIYARHGRLFDDEELQEYFNSFSWYEGTIDPDDFDTSVLNSTELENLYTLIDYETEMGYR